MGKRKSKVSKQKQAKAAAKSLKARVVKERVQVNGNSAPSSNKKNAPRKNGEDAEFRKQQTSMQERQMAEIQQKKPTTKKRGRNNNTVEKRFSSFAFQAPTLVVDDAKKSTNQLLGEVANRVQGWGGITGQEGSGEQLQKNNANDPFAPKLPISLKQVHQQTTLCSQYEQYQIQQSAQEKQQKNNRFALLQTDDDSDDEEKKRELQASTKSLFQFAPPSFAVPSNGNDNLNISANDIDPDL